MIQVIISVILSYLVGSIPFALVIGKLVYQTDIRNFGSGNLGGTNTFRVLGKKAGFSVTLLDMLKGGVALYIPIILSADIHPLICGAAAVFGHVFPIFAKFKGGKAVATSAGMLFFYNPLVFVVLIAIFFVILYFSKYVSLSSIVTSAITLITLFFPFPSLYLGSIALYRERDWIYAVILIILFVLLLVKHRTNISRIKNGTEPKITWI